MTISQHIASLRQKRAELPLIAAQVVGDAVETGVSLVKERSIEEGIDRDGQPGRKAQYSSKKVPSYYLTGKALNQAGRTYLKQNKTANWYGLRQAQGLRSTNVNLNYTGQLWRQFRVLSVTVANNRVTARIGLSGNRAEVFGYQTQRYGAFYRNTPAERARIRADQRQQFSSWLRR